MVRGLAPNSSSLDCAAELGVVDEVEGLRPVQTLVPRTQSEAAPNTYSGSFGYSEFPLHTDLAHWSVPPHFILLRCIRGAANVSTRLLDGQAVISHVGGERLRAALVQPRRPMRNGKQLLRLLGSSSAFSCDVFRWDSVYLHPATPESVKLFAEVVGFLREARHLEVSLLQPGDTLLIDNWRYLHGRSPAAEKDGERHLERVYLKEVR